MRHYTAKPRIRLPCLPVGLAPGTTISSICIGFQPLLLNPYFDALIDPLHGLCCLSIAFHFSGCIAHLEIPTFSHLCSSNKRWCQAHLKTSASYTFSLCLLAMMLFLELTLLSDNTDILCTSAMLQNKLQNDLLGRFCRDGHEVDVMDSLPRMCNSSRYNPFFMVL